MNIGIIGLGVVGSANKRGFELLGHRVAVHDIDLQTQIKDVLHTDCTFICVPTPSRDGGECDTDTVECVIDELDALNYQGVIAIRSSTVPGFTQRMIEHYSLRQICFVPEFVRERCAVHDFTQQHEVLAVGTTDPNIYDTVVKAHGTYPRHKVQLTPTEAEILKYYHNLYAATRVTFANAFYEICQKLDSDYTKIKDTYIKTGRAGPMYLDVNHELRGFGGQCLPKDTRAIVNLMDKLSIDLQLFKTVDADNSKIKTTIFNGMRSEDY